MDKRLTEYRSFLTEQIRESEEDIQAMRNIDGFDGAFYERMYSAKRHIYFGCLERLDSIFPELKDAEGVETR